MATPKNKRATSSEPCMRVIVYFGVRLEFRLLQKPARLSFLNERKRHLEFRLGGDWKSPPIAERLGGNLDSGCCLLPLIFTTLYHSNDAPHQIQFEIVNPRNLFSRRRLLHKVLENCIEHVIGWE